MIGVLDVELREGSEGIFKGVFCRLDRALFVIAYLSRKSEEEVLFIEVIRNTAGMMRIMVRIGVLERERKTSNI